jgi:hypothetical protein
MILLVVSFTLLAGLIGLAAYSSVLTSRIVKFVEEKKCATVAPPLRLIIGGGKKSTVAPPLRLIIGGGKKSTLPHHF